TTHTTLSDGTDARWQLAGDARCRMLVVDEAPGAEGAVSPPSHLGAVVEPTLFSARDIGSVSTPVCAADQQPLGLGCASVLDDRIVLWSGQNSALWHFSGDVSAEAVTPPEQPGVVLGFEPGATHQ